MLLIKKFKLIDITPELALIVCVFLGGLYVMLSFSLPGSSQFWASINNSGHTLVFMCLTFVFCLLTRKFHLFHSSLKIFSIIFIISMVYGGLIELVQSMIGRSASWEDIVLDSVGILVGILFYSALYTYKQYYKRILSVAIGMLLFSFAKPIFYFYIQYENKKLFPDIFNTVNNSLHRHVYPNDFAAFSIIEKPELWSSMSKRVGQIDFMPGDWPSIKLIEFHSDWQNYKYLSLDIFNPQIEEIEVSIRINDVKHNHNYDDRFNRSYKIKPGPSHIKILLDYVRIQPELREMDMEHISKIMIFMQNPDKQYTLYLESIRLIN